MQLAWGYIAPLTMEAAVRHGIFDLLDGGPRTIDEVARHTGASERGLRALMNALAGLQLLSRDADGNYGLTGESAAFLVSGKPGYVGGLIRHTSTQRIPLWLKLTDAVKEGKPAAGGVNREQTGTEFFHEFVEDLFPLSYRPALALAEVLDLGATRVPLKVLDIAAGSGVWGIALAQQSPRVSVTAVDWPGMLDVTRRTAARCGVEEQFTFVGGDILEADFGTGHEVATLGHILHSEGVERSRALLRKTYEALAPGGTIAIQEFLVNDDRSGPPMALMFAVNMLVLTDQGDTWSFNEIAGWLREAGFENPRTLDSPGPSPLILADRP
ncbi:MAG TPA: class I SAM-dependent methyltransferase [Bryobacteraceae bacterium]|nr:class I SAM-dependent methyltransferase [Bryobacteraceae bacterium]